MAQIWSEFLQRHTTKAQIVFKARDAWPEASARTAYERLPKEDREQISWLYFRDVWRK
jgi:hypothetical protein